MNFFAVYLQCKHFIAIKNDWVENAMVGNPSKIFYSENQNAVADFSTVPLYYLNKSINACYEVLFVYKSFGKFLMKFFFNNHLNKYTFYGEQKIWKTLKLLSKTKELFHLFHTAVASSLLRMWVTIRWTSQILHPANLKKILMAITILVQLPPTMFL